MAYSESSGPMTDQSWNTATEQRPQLTEQFFAYRSTSYSSPAGLNYALPGPSAQSTPLQQHSAGFASPSASPFPGATSRLAALGRTSSPLSRSSSDQRQRPHDGQPQPYINTDTGLHIPPGFLDAASLMSDSPGSASPSSLSRMTSQQSLASNLTASSSTSSLRAHSSRSSLKAARHRSRSRSAHSQYIRALSLTPMLGVPGSQVRIMMTVLPHPDGRIRSFRCCFGRTYADTRVTSQFQNDHNEDLEDVELTVIVPPSLSAALSDLAVIVEAADAHRHLVDWTPAGTFSVDTRDFAVAAPRQRSSDELRAFDPPQPARPRLPHQLSSSSLPPSFRQTQAAGPAFSSDVPVMPSPWQHQSAHISADDLLPSIGGITTAPGAPTTKIRGVAANTPSSAQLRHPPCEYKRPGQPYLVRSTLIPSGLAGGGSTKVLLRFRGDLGTMATGWSQDEWQARRRLVQFYRSQDNHIVEASFRAVRPIEYTEDAITISCIYREDKDECYITSVDSIYLLEALIGSHFTVEEKNRIRRNLEGFKPLTISKSKGENDGFFKTIMGFPAPKPRNIEKDVKVFPWRILVHMLTKIIGKYSATHAQIPGITTPSAAEPLVGAVGDLSIGGTSHDDERSLEGQDMFGASGLGLAPQSFNSQPWARTAGIGMGELGQPETPSSFLSSSVSGVGAGVNPSFDAKFAVNSPMSSTPSFTSSMPPTPAASIRGESHVNGFFGLQPSSSVSSLPPSHGSLGDSFGAPSLDPTYFAFDDTLSPASMVTPASIMSPDSV